MRVINSKDLSAITAEFIASARHRSEQLSQTIKRKHAEALRAYRQHAYQLPERVSNKNLPENVERHQLDIGEHRFQIVHFPAQNAQEIVFFPTGCKSRAVHWAPQIDVLANPKRAFITVNTSVPKNRTGFVDANREMFKRLMFDEKSPLHQIAKSTGATIKLLSHSFGNFPITSALLNEQDASQLYEIAERSVSLNPFHSSKSLNPDRPIASRISRRLYMDWHAPRHAEQFNGDTLPDIIYTHISRLMGEPPVWASDGPPAHCQVVELQSATDANREIALENGIPAVSKLFPTYAALATNDYMADYLAGVTRETALGSAIVHLKGAWHSPAHSHPAETLPILDELLTEDHNVLQERYAATSASPATRALHAT